MTKKSSPRGRKKSGLDLFIHTRNSYQLRYGKNLTKEQHAQMGEMIRNRDGEFLFRQTGSRTIWKLHPEWADGPVYAVYQLPLNNVCTVLSDFMVNRIIRENLQGYTH